MAFSPGKWIPGGMGGNLVLCGTLGGTKRGTETFHVEQVWGPPLGDVSQFLLRHRGLGAAG